MLTQHHVTLNTLGQFLLFFAGNISLFVVAEFVKVKDVKNGSGLNLSLVSVHAIALHLMHCFELIMT